MTYSSTNAIFRILLCAVLFSPPAIAMDDNQIFYYGGFEVDVSDSDDGTLVTWDADAWIGGDRQKLWLEAEGESLDGDVEDAEIQLLYSRPISEFWDFRAGLRQDFEPGDTTYAVLGVEGLAPYRFETEAKLFVSEDGDVSFRIEQEYIVQLTQRFIAMPHIEFNAFAQDVDEQGIGAGFSDLEVGLQFRYEVTRKFAPYVDLVYEKKLGETANIAGAQGEETDEFTARFGVKAWF